MAILSTQKPAYVVSKSADSSIGKVSLGDTEYTTDTLDVRRGDFNVCEFVRMDVPTGPGALEFSSKDAPRTVIARMHPNIDALNPTPDPEKAARNKWQIRQAVVIKGKYGEVVVATDPTITGSSNGQVAGFIAQKLEDGTLTPEQALAVVEGVRQGHMVHADTSVKATRDKHTEQAAELQRMGSSLLRMKDKAAVITELKLSSAIDEMKDATPSQISAFLVGQIENKTFTPEQASWVVNGVRQQHEENSHKADRAARGVFMEKVAALTPIYDKLQANKHNTYQATEALKIFAGMVKQA